MEVIFDDAEAPRAGQDPSAMGRWATRVARLEQALQELQRGSQLRDASISGGQGLRVLDNDGTLQAQISPDRTVTIFDQSGQPVVRMGDMQDSGPLEYGIEVRIGSDWIQLGSQNVTWENVGNKPATFTPSAHNHPGGEITSAVATATYATSSGAALQADGSKRAFDNPVGGTTFYAVWVGNDGNWNLGRNTSSMKYKYNYRPVESNPLTILNLEEVVFDRWSFEPPPDGQEGPVNRRPGSKNEYGVLAEQVARHVPDLIQRYQGEIDGVRYEMIGLKLVPVVRMHEGRLNAIEKEMAEIRNRQSALEQRMMVLEQNSAAAAAPPPKG